MGNPGESMAIAVHRYGPQIGEVDDRNYGPSPDYVRDRRKISSRSGASRLTVGLASSFIEIFEI